MAPLEAATLADQPAVIVRAQGCGEAAGIIGGPEPPHLVFVDAALPDASWADVIALSKKASVPINIIVVARLVDTRFYVEVIEAGAFDFIVPPFRSHDLRHVLRCALQNVLERRETQVRTENAAQRPLFLRGSHADRTNLPAVTGLRAADKAL